MNKKAALLLAILITGLIAANFWYFSGNVEREEVTVQRVIDGDTIVLDDGRTIRLININTPEKNEFGWEYSRDFLKEFENKTLELESLGTEKYGRTLGKVYAPEYVNLEIVKLGFASKYILNDESQSEIKSFREAEEQAVENGIGIWQRSEHYGCVNAEIDKKEEFVVLEILCEVSLEGWILKDESTKVFKLKDTGYSEIIIYSESGSDEENKLYWGRGDSWNNDRDSLFIRDSKGFLVYYYTYGY